MAKELYGMEQTTDLNLNNFGTPESVNQEKRDDILRSNTSPNPRFIAFVVLVSSALLFVASIYYGVINP